MEMIEQLYAKIPARIAHSIRQPFTSGWLETR